MMRATARKAEHEVQSIVVQTLGMGDQLIHGKITVNPTLCQDNSTGADLIQKEQVMVYDNERTCKGVQELFENMLLVGVKIVKMRISGSMAMTVAKAARFFCP